MKEILKRFFWSLFCIVTVGCGLFWIFFVPCLIVSDFWRGVCYPIVLVLGVGHFLMAGVFFWYTVLRRDKGVRKK